MKIEELLETSTATGSDDNTFMGTVKHKKYDIDFDVYAASPANRVGDRLSNLIYLIDKNTGKKVHKFNSTKEIDQYYDWVRLPGKYNEEVDGEYDDEAGMAHSNLHTMARAVNGLIKNIKKK